MALTLLLSCALLRIIVTPAEEPFVSDPCTHEPWHILCDECPVDVVVLPTCVGYDDGMMEALDLAFEDFAERRENNPSTGINVGGE